MYLGISAGLAFDQAGPDPGQGRHSLLAERGRHRTIVTIPATEGAAAC